MKTQFILLSLLTCSPLVGTEKLQKEKLERETARCERQQEMKESLERQNFTTIKKKFGTFRIFYGPNGRSHMSYTPNGCLGPTVFETAPFSTNKPLYWKQKRKSFK